MIAESMTIAIDAQGALIARAMAGDEVAFARIVAAHHGGMARIAYLICGSFDVAEEAEQAAWAKAWHRLGDVREEVLQGIDADLLRTDQLFDHTVYRCRVDVDELRSILRTGVRYLIKQGVPPR